ncbi:putative ribonuclease H-like domain-containing protein [Tanacetum coccineum]|uniref:Ribonuclease H-like domain-containing protein n=1 Tax=Tanacetum coccineum TaxID=301880 RepID=A0ABQ5AFQ8_9ASTR
MVLRAILIKSCLVSLNTARQINTAHPKITMNSARPMTNVSKPAHLTVKPKEVVNAARPKAVVDAVKGNNVNVVKASACWVWKPKTKVLDYGNPQMDLQDKGVIVSGCSRHMTGNMSYLTDYEEIDGGYVSFGGNPKGGKITGRGTIKTGNLDFENVYFVRELKFNLFSVSQMCDKKNSVLFNDTECIVLSPNFKLTDESHVLLKVPRKNNMYSVDLKNIVPKGGLTCLFAKATSDESKLWHRRLGHINFKTMNKLIKGNLVRGLPSKLFENNQTCVACQKGKQHRASYHLGKFDGKADEGFFVGYSINIKAFRVFNSRTRIVEENPHVQFSENTPNIVGSGPSWLFDIDALIKSMNYKPIVTGNQSNGNASTNACEDAGKARRETIPGKYYILLPLWPADPLLSQNSSSPDAGFKPSIDDEKKVTEELGKECGYPSKEDERDDQEKNVSVNSTNNVNVASTNEVNAVGRKASIELPNEPNTPALEDIVYSDDDENVGAEADMHNLDAFMPISPIPTTRVHNDHPVEQIIRDLNSAPQTRRMTKNLEEHGVCQPPGFEDPNFLDRVYKVEKALYGLHQAPRAWYETLSTYLLDNGFQRGKIDKTLFIRRDKGDILLVQVYVDDIIFGSTKKSLCTEFEKMMHKKFQMSSMGELTFFLGLQVKQKEDGIFISQDKYVTKILKKFGFTDVKTASTPMETQKLLLKDEDGEEVDVHLYRSMIGSLMYLTSSRPDIMFAVCACARYQVNPKVSHLHAVKRIFRYLKGQPKLGLWYPKDSPFDLVAYTDSDYAGASLDRKSTTGGCQFNPKVSHFHAVKRIFRYLKGQPKLVLWYMAASSCYGQVKTINREVQLQSLVDGKKIIIAEASVRRDLQLNDEEGTDYLPNATIFEELTRMGFVQVFLEKQLEGMSNHKRIYVTSSHTKKIFRNMRRVGKGFSRRDTPLFPTMMVQAQKEQGKGSAMPTDPQHTPTIIQPSTSQPQLKQRSRRPKRKDTKVPQPSGPTDNVADKALNEEMDDNLVMAATTTSSLEAEQDGGNIDKTRSKATLNEPSFLGTSSGSGPRCQDTMGDIIARTRVLNLENTKTAQAQEITLVHGTQGRYGDEEMFDTVSTADLVTTAGEVVTIASVEISTTSPTKTVIADDLTIAQTLIWIRNKGKGIMVEEPVKMKKKDQISIDEELAFKLQAEEEEERLAREKAQREEEANIISWDNLKAMIDADYQMA